MQTQERNVFLLFLYSVHYSTLKDISTDTNKTQKNPLYFKTKTSNQGGFERIS